MESTESVLGELTMDQVQKAKKLVETAQENLHKHAQNAPIDSSLNQESWRQWIREYKRLGQKVIDAQIGYYRHLAMEKQGIQL